MPATAGASSLSVTVEVAESYVTGVVASSAMTSGSAPGSLGVFVSSGAVTAKLAGESGNEVSRASSKSRRMACVLENSATLMTGAVGSIAMRTLFSWPGVREEVAS